MALIDVFNDAGTMVAIDLLLPYSRLDRSTGLSEGDRRVQPWHVGLAIASPVLLTIPIIDSVYPVPPALVPRVIHITG
jgi:hypothetical protein